MFMGWFRGKGSDHSVLMTRGHQRDTQAAVIISEGPLTACLCSFILHLLLYLFVCECVCMCEWERNRERVCESMCVEISEQHIRVISLLYHVGSEDIKPDSPGLAADVCTSKSPPWPSLSLMWLRSFDFSIQKTNKSVLISPRVHNILGSSLKDKSRVEMYWLSRTIIWKQFQRHSKTM